ncbi:MAG TPA: hypothetical protein VFY99_01755 [Solirubrobacterales bacterium]
MPDAPPQGHRAGGLTAAPGRASEPTLPELLRAAWRRSGRLGRAALVLLALAILAVAAWLLLGRGGDSFAYSGPEAPPFSISWSELDRAEAPPGALLALGDAGGETLTVRPLETAAGDGGEEPLPGLALAADDAAARIADAHPGARIVLEGRTELAVDRGPEAYQLAFTAPGDGDGIVIGKALLVPDPDDPGRGVEIEIAERTTSARVAEKVGEAPAGFFLNWPIQLLLEDAASVRTSEAFEEPLRSFAFG